LFEVYRQEVLSVVIRQASQLRLSFFETKDISDFGSLKEVAGIFVPGTVLPSTPVIFISRDLHIWLEIIGRMLHALECLICSMFGLLGHGSMYISLCIEFLGLLFE
jgi:hypothetical protein